MKRIKHGLLVLLPILLLALTSFSPASAKDLTQSSAIPIKIFTSTLALRADLTRAKLKVGLAGIFQQDSSLDTVERLQYDAQLAADTAPVTFVFDFDRRGLITRVLIDAYTKEQNPTVTTLLKWLHQHAGKPDIKKPGRLVWKSYAGWIITHEHHGDGEDATYRITLDRRSPR